MSQQHLIWQNDELCDDQSLKDCSIPGGATLRLVLGLRGGPMNAYRAPTIRLTPIHFSPPQTSALQRISSATHAARSLAAMTTNSNLTTTQTSMATTSPGAGSNAAAKTKREKEIDSDAQSGEKSVVDATSIDSDTCEKNSRQKHIAFFIVKDGNSLDLRVFERYTFLLCSRNIRRLIFSCFVVPFRN